MNSYANWNVTVIGGNPAPAPVEQKPRRTFTAVLTGTSARGHWCDFEQTGAQSEAEALAYFNLFNCPGAVRVLFVFEGSIFDFWRKPEGRAN